MVYPVSPACTGDVWISSGFAHRALAIPRGKADAVGKTNNPELTLDQQYYMRDVA